jgi:hypothetical protein
LNVQHSILVRQALLTLHFIGLGFGFGGATVADISFARALRMGDRITPETVNWMRTFSKLVWLGIGVLTLSGLGLFLQQPQHYVSSSGFLAKMMFVSILVINGLFLNFYVTARLTTFNFSQRYQHRDAAWKARKLSFVFGAISTVTWYATVVTAEFKNVIRLPLLGYIGIYLAVVIAAIVSALLLEVILYKHLSVEKPLTVDQLTRLPLSSYSAAAQPAVGQPSPQAAISSLATKEPSPTERVPSPNVVSLQTAQVDAPIVHSPTSL